MTSRTRKLTVGWGRRCLPRNCRSAEWPLFLAAGVNSHEYQDMSLFKASKVPPDAEGAMPVNAFDLSKRYDLYASTPSEDRVYQDVKIVGIRSFDPVKGRYGSAIIGGYLEIEAPNGTRTMIPAMRLYMICEHGSEATYKVLRVRKTDADG